MIKESIDKDKWDKLLADNKSSIFQTQEWALASSNSTWSPIYLINGDYESGMVLMKRSDNRAYESMIAGCYGGPIGGSLDINQLISPKMNYIRIIDYNNVLNFNYGWYKILASTYIIDLSTFKISHGVKDNIRIAKKSNIKIKETSNMDLFYKIYLACYENFNLIERYDKYYFERIKRYLKDKAKFYIMYSGRKPIGMSLQLFYKDEIFNLYNACIDSYRKYGCISMLMNNVIEENKLSYKTYNLGAATSEGAHTFKANWGAKRYDYPIYGKIINYDYKNL